MIETQKRLTKSTEWTLILHCPILNNPMFLLSCLVPVQHQSLGSRSCSPSIFSVFRGELREESGLSWLDWVGCKSVLSLGWCPACFSLRRAGYLAGQCLCPPVFRFGALRVVSCQLPDVPPPWELERDARGLHVDVLSGCVGLTELVEGIHVLNSPVRLDLRRLICLTPTSARDHSTPARLRGHRKQPGVQTNQRKRPAGLAQFGVYCLVRLYLTDSPLDESGRQPRTFGVLRALRPLTSLGLDWPSGL